MSESNYRTDDLEKRTSALEAANNLTVSLDENTEALNRVRKKYRVTMALLALVVVTILLGIKFNHDGNVAICQNTNVVRSEIDAKWDAVAHFLVDNGYGATQEEKKFLDVLRTDIDKRDCSDVSWIGVEEIITDS